MSQVTIACPRAKGSGVSVERSGTSRHSPTGLNPDSGCKRPARVQRQDPFREPHPGSRPPGEAVPVDGLRLGNARVIHEHEPHPQSILGQRPPAFPRSACIAPPTSSVELPLPAMARPISHAPASRSTASGFGLQPWPTTAEPLPSARPSSAISLSPALRVAALRMNETAIPTTTQSMAMIGYHRRRHVAEERVPDDDQRQERHHDLPHARPAARPRRTAASRPRWWPGRTREAGSGCLSSPKPRTGRTAPRRTRTSRER